MPKALKERRKSPRIDSRLALQVERVAKTSTERPLTTETANVASGGIQAPVRVYLEPGTKVSLTLLLPSFGRTGKKTQVVSCKGSVLRCQPHPGDDEFLLTCAFSDIKKEDKSLIDEYIGWRMNQDRVDERLCQP